MYMMQTGIRSPKVLGTVRRVILDPLRRLLGETTPEVEARGHHHRGDEGGYSLSFPIVPAHISSVLLWISDFKPTLPAEY